MRLVSLSVLASVGLLLALQGSALASGELVPTRPGAAPLRIIDHDLDVVIQNGFARTEVTQVFRNDTGAPLEATYSFPLPREASLSEMKVRVGEHTLRGEVVATQRAVAAYEDAKRTGEDAALATKDGHRAFVFQVAQVPASAHAVVSFVYYEPLQIDTGVARYVYPLEAGGNDDGGSFWTNAEPDGDLSVSIEVKSAWPVGDVRMPGWGAAATVDQPESGHVAISAVLPDDAMDRDLVLYYKLADDLPGRIEVIPYRPGPGAQGTFMAVVTPGMDLQPLDHGWDFVFVVDTSGSMAHTMATVADAIAQVLPELRPEDRFRVVAFGNSAHELVPWTPATEVGVSAALAKVKTLQAQGGTDLYAGLSAGLDGVDADRATALVLLTDAVANSGEVRPERFTAMLDRADLRVFCFMMGNSGNWPLLNAISDASGGIATGVSTGDDIVGQVLLAKSKMTHEALHGAEFTIGGAEIHGVTSGALGKVFRGEQLVVFGRYDEPGTATLTLEGRITGEPVRYETTVELPAVALDNPELERLWALRSIENAGIERDRGRLTPAAAADLTQRLGVQYQLVTDHTAMIALTDGGFSERGIERKNQARTQLEHEAQARKAAQPAPSYRADAQRPSFPGSAPSVGGGGALDPISGGLALGLGALALWRKRR